MLEQVLRCTSCAGDLEAHPPTRSPSNRWLCATHIGQQSCRHRLRVKKARSASPFSRSIMLPLNLREDCPRRRRQEWIWSEPLGRAARPSSTAQTPTATGPPWDTTAAIAEDFRARGARTDGRARLPEVDTCQPHLFKLSTAISIALDSRDSLGCPPPPRKGSRGRVRRPPVLAILHGHAQVPDLTVDCNVRARRRRRRRLSGGATQTGRSGSRTGLICPSPARMAARQPSDPDGTLPTGAQRDRYTWVG